MDGQQPNRNQEQKILFKKLAGDVRQLTLEDAYGNDFQSCAIFNWFDSRTRRRSDIVIESTIAVLTMALIKKDKEIDSELFSQEA